MKLSVSLLLTLLTSTSIVSALSVPQSSHALARREAENEAIAAAEDSLSKRFDESLISDLIRRKGGGGGGGGGGKGGGGSSGGSSGGSKGTGGTSGTSGTSGGSSGVSGGSSSAGGRTVQGTGPSRGYGGGSYYGGGAAVPYAAGKRSSRGILPFLLPVAALGIFPGLWLYGAYAYPYGSPYSFRNQSDSGRNTTIPILCLCQEYSACSCDENTNATYTNQVIGNGSESDMDPSVSRIATVNGTKTLVINGTLPNGTTAPGGTSTTPSAGSRFTTLMESSGYWVMIAVVGLTVWWM